MNNMLDLLINFLFNEIVKTFTLIIFPLFMSITIWFTVNNINSLVNVKTNNYLVGNNDLNYLEINEFKSSINRINITSLNNNYKYNDDINKIEEKKEENKNNIKIKINSSDVLIILLKFWLLCSEVKKTWVERVINRYKNNKITILGIIFSVIFFLLVLDIFSGDIEQLYSDKEKIEIIEKNYIGSMETSIDILSSSFIWLNVFIFPISHISNWSNVPSLKSYYVIIMLVLELLLTDVFIVDNFISFYVAFESTLPLLFFLIGLYGASQKFRAGFYIFLYTLMGSLFMLLSFVKMGGDIGSTSFQTQSFNNLNNTLELWLWSALFISFSIKTPIVPGHIWLPLAHSDANVSGSIILASVVLKLALYGFIRILIGILQYSTKLLNPFVMSICALSIIYSSVSTIRQFDLKVLVAYSSIAHMGSTILGAFSNTLYGIVGSVLFGLAHGFVSPALFILVGAIIYDRCGSRIINYYRGLSNITPIFSLFFLFFLFGNMGVPLTANFIGEFLSLLAAFQSSLIIVSLATLSVVFSAIYSIFLFNRVTSGTVSNYIKTIPDLFRREFIILLPLAVFTLILGIYPYFITSQLELGLSSFLM